jgi:hypothetical protein
MPENDNLRFKSPLGPEQRDHEPRQDLQTIDHPASDYPIRVPQATPDEVLGNALGLALKLRFDPLTPAQAPAAFQWFFGIETPVSLPAELAPGDFANVKRKHAVLGDDARVLTEWLIEDLGTNLRLRHRPRKRHDRAGVPLLI